MYVQPSHDAVRKWLMLCCAMIFLMAVIGAITRLTESGLSITRWEPVKGALPPLNEADWEKAFTLYKATPQYAGIHSGMSLDEFKGIYFWEWIHRLWGRLIGLVYALPFFYFLLRKKIPPTFVKPLWGILCLGGLQGFMGWFMVQSGLEPGQVAVSPYRLAMHLGLALIIYAAIFWQILRLADKPFSLVGNVPARTRATAQLALILLAFTIFWGALTAGLDAGKIYNSFPLMNGDFFPSDAVHDDPFWQTFTQNAAAVQWLHRILATLTLIVTGYLAAVLWHNHRWLGKALLAALCIQYGLGIFTLLTGVNIILATLHQANAIIALSLMLCTLHALKTRA